MASAILRKSLNLFSSQDGAVKSVPYNAYPSAIIFFTQYESAASSDFSNVIVRRQGVQNFRAQQLVAGPFRFYGFVKYFALGRVGAG